MPHKTLSGLATDGVRALWDRRKFTQKQLAERAKIPTSSVNRIMQGTQPVTLDVLEAAGELAGVNPLEMLLDPKTEMKMLTPQEAQFLRQIRTWPSSTREGLLRFLEYFADEDPAETQLRQAHEHLRQLSVPLRGRAAGYLVYLLEGGLTPDVRIALGLPPADDELRKQRRMQHSRGTPNEP